MLGNLYRVYKLNPRQRQICIEAVVILPLFALGLKIFGFKPLMRFVQANSRPASTVNQLAEAKEIASLVYRVANHLPFHSSCLVRSLTLCRILQNQKLPSELVIGVAKSREKQFTAHAWVEYQGTPLTEASDIETLYTRILASHVNGKSFS